MIALGGGAVLSEATRERLHRRAHTILLLVDPSDAWERTRGADRPLARDEAAFRDLFAARTRLYTDCADGLARSANDVVLGALGITVIAATTGVSVAVDVLVADEVVLGLHPRDFGCPVLTLPPGEQAKRHDVVSRVWEELDVERGTTLPSLRWRHDDGRRGLRGGDVQARPRLDRDADDPGRPGRRRDRWQDRY